ALGRACAPPAPVVGRRHLLHAHARTQRLRTAGTRRTRDHGDRRSRRALHRSRRPTHAVELADGRLIPRAAVFMMPTMRLRAAELIASLGCKLDEAGFIRADPTLRTSVPGVWVAGNATNPRAQVITAAGEGSTAAIAINADLVQEDVQTALRGDTLTVNH